MSRQLSSPILEALTAAQTAEAFLVLLTVKNNAKDVLARFTSDAVDTLTAKGNFLPYPFDIVLPDHQDQQETRARLVLTNVDRQLIEAVRSELEFLYVDIEVVLGSNPDDALVMYPDMELRNLTYTTALLSGELGYESFLREPYPKDLMTGRFYPGLFIQ